MDKHYIVDTNVLLDDLTFLEGKKIVILSHVLRELDKHKSNKEKKDLALGARRAVRWIKANKMNDNVIFDLSDYLWEGEDPYENLYVDNLIIKACLVKGYGLITKDSLLSFKAEGFGIELVDLDNGISHGTGNYTGFLEISVSNDDELADIYEDKSNPLGLLINQYLIINYNGEQLCHRWDGKELIDIDLPPKRLVEPQNAHQACALDLLWNSKIPIKIITGTYGSGKTYLSTVVGIELVNGNGRKGGSFDKLLMVRNPIGSGEQIGFMPGNKEEKIGDFYKPILQHFKDGEQGIIRMEHEGKLEKEIPFYMKGLSIDNTVILVDEAEDLNEKLIKLIGTRLGKKSVVVFSGDFNQAEDKYVYNNGLYIAIDKLKGNPLVGIVSLQEDIRSDASKVFADM